MPGAASTAKTGVPPKPKNRNGSPKVVWTHWAPFGDELFRSPWVFAPIGSSDWTIGYRIELEAGAPYIAEQRTWLTDAPFWQPGIPHPRPSSPPNLDQARKTLSPRQAIQAWRDISERSDETHAWARRNGFDRTAPTWRRPDDPHYATVARLYVECRRQSKNYARMLADQLNITLAANVTPAAARKLVHTCRRRELLDANDELTPYARRCLGID